MLTSCGKTRNSALANALDSPRRGGPSGIGKAAPKRKERPVSNDERAVPAEVEGGGTPERRPAPGHPDGTPPAVVVAKVVERGIRAEAVRTRSASAKAISDANLAQNHGGLVDPAASLVPEESTPDLASASKKLFGEEDVQVDVELAERIAAAKAAADAAKEEVERIAAKKAADEKEAADAAKEEAQRIAAEKAAAEKAAADAAKEEAERIAAEMAAAAAAKEEAERIAAEKAVTEAAEAEAERIEVISASRVVGQTKDDSE